MHVVRKVYSLNKIEAAAVSKSSEMFVFNLRLLHHRCCCTTVRYNIVVYICGIRAAGESSGDRVRGTVAAAV